MHRYVLGHLQVQLYLSPGQYVYMDLALTGLKLMYNFTSSCIQFNFCNKKY